MARAGNTLYLSSYSGLIVLDVANPGQPKEIRRIPLLDDTAYKSDFGRRIALEGDRLYVERFWPHELAVFDIRVPDRPIEIGQLYVPHFSVLDRLSAGSGSLYRTSWDRIKALKLNRIDLFNLGETLISPGASGRFINKSNNAEALVKDGFVYAILENGLAVFRQE